jgi:hypothetical protein
VEIQAAKSSKVAMWRVPGTPMTSSLPGAELFTIAGVSGLEIAWWTGRPRSGLALPIDEAFTP